MGEGVNIHYYFYKLLYSFLQSISLAFFLPGCFISGDGNFSLCALDFKTVFVKDMAEGCGEKTNESKLLDKSFPGDAVEANNKVTCMVNGLNPGVSVVCLV